MSVKSKYDILYTFKVRIVSKIVCKKCARIFYSIFVSKNELFKSKYGFFYSFKVEKDIQVFCKKFALPKNEKLQIIFAIFKGITNEGFKPKISSLSKKMKTEPNLATPYPTL